MIKMTKKHLIIAILVAIVIAGVIIAFAMWVQMNSVSQQSLQPGKKVPQYATNDQKLVDALNQKYGQGDYKGAIKLIEGQQAVQDVGMQLLLAGAYANSGDYKKAFEIYQTLDKAGKLPNDSLGNLGDMAEKAGDKQAAIDAYKRAKEYFKSSSEIDDQAAIYDYKISQLESR